MCDILALNNHLFRYMTFSVPKITLEQWAALRAVIDEGSYAKAAEKLNKSQSSVSYAISRLNALLPGPALVVNGRKAELTELGTTLYRHAKQLLEQAYTAEQVAINLAAGWESQITIVADALTPMAQLFCALQKFSDVSPLTRIKILETSLSGTDEVLFNRECELALTPRIPPGFLGDPLTQIRMLAVAHPDHPLAQQSQISEDELKVQRQVVVRDSGTKRQQDVGWLGSEQRWTVSHFATSVEAVKAGLGFAFVPEHRILEELRNGELVVLALDIGSIRTIHLNLIVTQSKQSGPATQALAKIIKESFKS